MAEDQGETIAFLSRPDSYGWREGGVARVETHYSIVFLVGDRAYKLKRAVAVAAVDYATIEKRERACKAELDLNRRTAPELYLAARAIRRGADGLLTFDGDGPAVDWVVVMRRFDQADMFDHLADARRLSVASMRQLADEIAAFHAAAEITPNWGGSTGIRAFIEGWRREWASLAAPVDGPAGQAYYADASATLAQNAGLLDRRRAQGKVRRCHGDLRLANICLLEGRPTLFDCVEFDDEVGSIDVLYDLAFLLMDLHHRGLAEFGNILFNRYVDVTGDDDGLAALPLFLSLRAALRAQMLAASVSRHSLAEAQHRLTLARSHLALAKALLHPRPPRLIAIGGLSSSTKSAIAYGLAADLAPAPGARVIRSDTVRRRLIKASPQARLPAVAYDTAATRSVYGLLLGEAASALAAGATVVADATFLQPEDRHAIAGVARAAGIPFTGLWLQTTGAAGAAQSEQRPGDAAARDLRRQPALGAADWHMIDAGRGPASSLAAARLLTEGAGTAGRGS